ncbi:MAG TPA: DUF305 domain-containing protein [Bryobacteraceae bacterium]|nr:DUF305 domain-containing protein [Bryobacteraceae bacterium]
MALRFSFLTLGLVCLAQLPAQVIVQPGAPGQNSKILTPASLHITPRAPSDADVKFMQGMIHHHSQAVEMVAMMPARTHNKALLKLGQRISISQTDEIQYMQQWLRDRGKAVPMKHDMSHMNGMSMSGMMDMDAMAPMPGMLTPKQMKALAASHGARFDYLFLTGMIQHHTGALIMVDDLFDSPGAGQDPLLFDFATDVTNTQTAEINIMKGLLNENSKEKK